MTNDCLVIGGGLAGAEAAVQLARAGLRVTLAEMKPVRFSPAHKSDNLAELVCSNSLKAERLNSAGGLLKAEMRMLGSVCVEAAYTCRVPAGGALAVDRDLFSQEVTRVVSSYPNIRIVREEITKIPLDRPVIVAAGPLASDALSASIAALCGGFLSFFDAAAPIVTAESIDMDHAFVASRYDRGGEDDYINCPMNREEYEAFYEALITAERAQIHAFEKGKNIYEGCMPIEVMAQRGADTIRFGPLKPVGLRDPRTGHRPWAVLQLRRENLEGTLFNLVGFQTNLKFGEQQRVFSMIPALHRAEFIRYGVMHRNTFIDAPRLLTRSFAMMQYPHVFFAGQITGVEGYMESAASGLLAGMNLARRLCGEPEFVPPEETMLGALCRHVSISFRGDYQPMGANFGILPPLEKHVRDKQARYALIAERAMRSMQRAIRKDVYMRSLQKKKNEISKHNALERARRRYTMVLDTILQMVADQMHMDVDEITESTVFAEIGADDMDIADLVMTVEDAFETEISIDEANAIETVSDLVDLAERAARSSAESES